MYDWRGDTSLSLLFSARVLMFSAPKQKGLNRLHKTFAQAQGEEACKKISPS